MGIEDYKDVTRNKGPHTEREQKLMDEIIERHVTDLFNEVSARDICGACVIKSLLVSIIGTTMANFGAKRGGEILQTAVGLVAVDFLSGGELSKIIEVKDQKKH